jgi:hypothetical protein
MMDCVALVEKVVDKMITPAFPPPLDERACHQMVQWSMESAASVTKNGGLGLQDLPWMITRPPPTSNKEMSPAHLPVLLTAADTGDFVEVTA